ncbi:hypothetical protein M422DRAFT_27151 [Sphaerobolus stellatus SS14]|uniref:Uncharacterized protein n=1 Tax=Sphaerobolus stellatus (strain SS14) TaxID=990650 RepID=A0A0C9T4G0_SPHS4|nr:hypothetical protein M422DRAFT_39464 [Sphaerobolus stellatus SS14]KIJ51087.1 hypothetical protein M422DRAFT_27151 [Sphaerobolus stellatus SS14]
MSPSNRLSTLQSPYLAETPDRKYESMKSAVTELARIDMRLAREANKKADPRMRTDEEL